ncbi:MAG: hypothetical protein U0133_21625 [Gemmatimonadales bacterium]
MHSLRRRLAQRGLGLCLLLLTFTGTPGAAQSADTTGAAGAIRDYLAAAAADHGRLWGHSLAGPMILVDPATRQAFASEQPPGGEFSRRDGLWEGVLPAGIPLANFALTWSGRRWAMVLLPLSRERFLALELLLHEAYHGVQDTLGLGRMDLLNPHLDEREGRYWLRLELRALAAALETTGKVRREAAGDAMRFRAVRLARYPGADSLEESLEVAEGLAEYTGTRVALSYLRMPASRAARMTRDFEGRKTYVRSLGYGTGPGLGLLLDEYRPGWRARVKASGPAAQLAEVLHIAMNDTVGIADRAARYGSAALAAEENARAAARERQLAAYRAALIDGPVLVLRQQGVQRAFNPNELIPLGADGTIYPTGTFSAKWGSLEVEQGGALLAADFSMLRLPAPASAVAPGDSVVKGAGWTLTLASGWKVIAGQRTGDWEVVAK